MPCSGLNSAARLYVLCFEQQVDRGGAVPGASRVVGDQADPLAAERRESIGAQRVESGHHRRQRPGNS